MKLIEYPDRDMMMIDIANQIAGELESALLTGGRASLSVPGGTTPGPIFDVLCAADIDWANVAVILNDERWVPECSERSNTRLLRERLLTDRAAVAQFVPLYTPADSPEEGIPQLTPAVEAVLPLTVLLLGMGADMHTASLFPGADRLADALAPDAPTLMAMRADGAGEPRVTLTAPVLEAAVSKHIVITGTSKKNALEEAKELDEMSAPVRAVWRGAKVHWAE